MAEPTYTFLPFLRRGLVQKIVEKDAFAATASAGRPRLAAELVVGAHPIDGSAIQRLSFTKDLQLVGPGDVLTIKSSAFIGSVPRHGSNEFLADLFPFVELYEEDFPWRYTPAAPDGDKLRPWIFLLVLEPTEVIESRANPLGPEYPPFIELKGVSLPPPAETYAWAHVQIASDLDPAQALVRSPDACLARLVSPRRLKPATRYIGFVVPTFETGRRAAFERDGAVLATIPAQAPAWGAGDQTGLQLPYYYRFEFGTSGDAAFEELVRRLQRNSVVDALRGRPVDVTAPGFGLDGLAAQPTVLVEGALKPISPPQPSGVGAAFTRRLRDLLDAGDALADTGAAAAPHPYETSPGFPALFAEDPMVLPPIYGRWHGGGWRITDVARTPSWISELNLDPRHRMAAAVGAAIVRDRDDELVERAFKQLQGIRELERARREAELAIAVGQSIFERHLQTADAERTLTATAAMHGALRSSAASTIKADVEASRVPRAAMSAALKKVARPGGKLDRALGTGLRTSLIDGVNTERVSASPPVPEPTTAITAGNASGLIASAKAKFTQDVAAIGRWVFAEAAVRTRLQRPGAPLDPQWRDAHRVHADAIIAAPPIGGARAQAIRDRVTTLRDALVTKTEGPQTVFHLATATYKQAFGDVPGKIYRGVEAPPATWVLFLAEGAAVPTSGVARMASPFDLATYEDAFGDFAHDIVDGRGEAEPRPALAGTTAVARQVQDAVRPQQTVRKRVAARLARTPADGARGAAPSVETPIMAHPRFPDPLVDDLRRIASEHLLPNLSTLPDESLTLLVPNAPFIESLLAGANHELARELLWREFPTDLRGSYFLNFWDAGDGAGGDDAPPLDRWTKPLGQNLNRTTTGVSVLVIRGTLVRQFPNVVVYAQRGVRTAAGRTLSELPGDLELPTLRAQLAADTLAVAFAIDPAEAIGDPGWFLVFKERPGELGFGMDDGPPVPLASWDDLNFQHAGVAEGAYVKLSHPVQLATPDPEAATWGTSSADMADILFQLPFLMARHASELF